MHDHRIPLPDRITILDRLGRLYRHARVLRRLLRLLDEAERIGLPLTTADHIPTPPAGRGVGHE